MSDFYKEKGKFKVEFSILNEISKNPMEYLKRPNYVYFEPNDYKNVKIPCGIINFQFFTINEFKTIFVGKKEYFVKVEIKQMLDYAVLTINNSISYNTKDNMFTFSLNGELSLSIKNIDIINDLRKYKYIEIDSKKIYICDDGDYSIIEKQIEIIFKVKKIIDELHIKHNIIIDFSDSTSIKNIGIIYNNMVDKKGIPFNENGECFLIKMKVFNIAVYFSVQKNGSGLYDLTNLFDLLKDENERFSYVKSNGERKLIYPNFSVFQKQYKLEASCLLSENILDRLDELEFDKCKISDNDDLSANLTWFVLECLKLYDEKAEQKLLEFIEKISKALIEKENEIYFINYCQILKIKNKLSAQEIDTMIAIKDKSTDLMIKASISILIDSDKDFEFYMGKMTKEESNIFKEYPIYDLYKKTKNEI